MFQFSRSARRFVAGAATVLFLAYQGTAFVYAHSTGAPESSSNATPVSCHDPGQQTGKTANNNTCQANCQSQLISSGSSGAVIVAAADLAAITTRTDRIVAVADSATPADSQLLQAEPPPLAILHYCLRN